jgi:hypothetical protein
VKLILDFSSYARKAAAKATPNTDAREETAKGEAPLESPEAPPLLVGLGVLPLLVPEAPLPLGLAVPEGAGELEDEGKAVAAAA